MLSLKNGIRPKKREGRGNNGIRLIRVRETIPRIFSRRVRSNFEEREKERERLGAGRFINISLHFERDSFGIRDFISRNTV